MLSTPLNDLIEVFKSDEWNLNLGICGTTQAMLRVLENNADVHRLRKLYQEQDIKQELKQIIETLISAEFQPGFRFPYDTLLSAVVVAVRNENDPFTQEYLRDLAACDASELAESSRVAREILRERGEELPSVVRITPCVQIDIRGPLSHQFNKEVYDKDWFAVIGGSSGPNRTIAYIYPSSLEEAKAWLRERNVRINEDEHSTDSQ